MNKEFITYEQALALKELGFKEACFMCWYINKPTELYIGGDEKNGEGLAAPLYQQAFRFFREKYKLFHHTRSVDEFREDVWWECKIYGKTKNRRDIMCQPAKTYEEAELECLKKLIEIVNAAAIKDNNQ